MTNQRRGYVFELDVINDLRGEGYETIRAAASKGPIDVVAFKPGQILAIQIKINGRIGPTERQRVLKTAMMLGAVPLIAHKQVGRKKPRYDLLFGPGPQDRTPFRTDEIAI